MHHINGDSPNPMCMRNEIALSPLYDVAIKQSPHGWLPFMGHKKELSAIFNRDFIPLLINQQDKFDTHEGLFPWRHFSGAL
jgi:hypothetical protein